MTADELEERVAAAHDAKTRGDLSEVPRLGLLTAGRPVGVEINWPIPVDPANPSQISAKDAAAPRLAELTMTAQGEDLGQ